MVAGTHVKLTELEVIFIRVRISLYSPQIDQYRSLRLGKVYATLRTQLSQYKLSRGFHCPCLSDFGAGN